MKVIWRITVVILMFYLLVCRSECGFAAEDRTKEVLTDSLYGGIAGVLVGAAVMAFTKRPGDHLEYMAYGAAAGVVAGTTYALFKSPKALAELENGKVKLAVPTIMPDIKDTNSKGRTPVVIMAELFRGNF